ncbi:hypothetical protein DSECCO2_513590 [anaerobic digester metagenome]
MLPVIQEERNTRTVTGYILDPAVLHQRIDTRPAEEVAFEVVTEPEDRSIGEGEAVLHEEALHLPGKDLPAVGGHVMVVEDQNVPEVVEEPFQEFVLELREHRLKEEVFGLVCLRIAGYHGKSKAFGDPVAIDLLVDPRDRRFDKGAVRRGVVSVRDPVVLPGAEETVKKTSGAGPLPGRRGFSLRRHRPLTDSLAHRIPGCSLHMLRDPPRSRSRPTLPSTWLSGVGGQRTGDCMRLYVVWNGTYINLLFYAELSSVTATFKDSAQDQNVLTATHIY